MINSGKYRFGVFVLFIMAMGFVCQSAAAQDRTESREREFCSQNNYYGDNRVGFRELRESTVAAGNLLTVNGKRNGGIRVVGSDRRDVLVRACIQTWGASDDAARSMARNIRIETSPIVRAENLAEESSSSVSYEILVPRATNLRLNTRNGGISISAVEGDISFEAENGGVSLSEIGGDVRGRTMNGGVNVKLFGNTWRGKGLDVQTTNGGVNLLIPENYAARVEAGTTNGGFKSDISSLNVERESGYGWRPARLNKEINGGGAPIRVITTNGGVRIRASTSSR